MVEWSSTLKNPVGFCRLKISVWDPRSVERLRRTLSMRAHVRVYGMVMVGGV